MYACMYVHVCVCICVFVNVCVHVCARVYVCANLYVYVCVDYINFIYRLTTKELDYLNILWLQNF